MTSSSEFAWGQPDSDGVVIGLRVDPTGGYGLAFANRSDQPRQ